MRIGLFTDTYHPTINGITYVVESLKNNLEQLGHEVYIFCPGKTMLAHKGDYDASGGIFYLRSFPSGFFEDFDLTVFNKMSVVRKIGNLDLDIIHYFTPSQVGMLAISAARKYDIPIVAQHSTDLYEFVEHYPNVLPGVLALVGMVMPMSVKLNGKDLRELARLHKPRKDRTVWSRQVIARAITMLYSKADAALALSRKSYAQLKSWQDEDYSYRLEMMPNGVDAIPEPTEQDLVNFRAKWQLDSSDKVFGFVGRLSADKNLPLLIDAMDIIGKQHLEAKLLFVGDFEYREALEQMARDSRFADRIVFTGALPRAELGVVYAAMDIFAFPSTKDTQGWVLHEAAHAGCPIVMVDPDLSEVVVDGENGFIVTDKPEAVAEAIGKIFDDPSLALAFGKRSKQLAAQMTEQSQVKKLVELYQDLIRSR